MSSNGTGETQESESFTRYFLVIGVATPISLAGIFTNSILLFLFRRKKYSETACLYLAALALLDILLCISYLPMFTVDVIATYNQIAWLHWTWYHYVLSLLTISRITQLSSTYMILAATIDRFLMVLNAEYLKIFLTTKSRKITILAVFLLCLTLRIGSFWEYNVVEYANYTNPMDRYEFEPLIIREKWYRNYFSLYFMNFFQVFIPFVLLTLLNCFIVIKMKKTLTKRRKNVFRFATVPSTGRQKIVKYVSVKLRLQSATYTTVAIVTTYLICNSLDLFVKMLENFAPESAILFAPCPPPSPCNHPVPTQFYRLAADLISIFFAFNSFLRLFIYWTCNRELQMDLNHMFNCFRRRANSDRSNLDITNNGVEHFLADLSKDCETEPAGYFEQGDGETSVLAYGTFTVIEEMPAIDTSDSDSCLDGALDKDNTLTETLTTAFCTESTRTCSPMEHIKHDSYKL